MGPLTGGGAHDWVLFSQSRRCPACTQHGNGRALSAGSGAAAAAAAAGAALGVRRPGNKTHHGRRTLLCGGRACRDGGAAPPRAGSPSPLRAQPMRPLSPVRQACRKAEGPLRTHMQADGCRQRGRCFPAHLSDPVAPAVLDGQGPPAQLPDRAWGRAASIPLGHATWDPFPSCSRRLTNWMRFLTPWPPRGPALDHAASPSLPLRRQAGAPAALAPPQPVTAPPRAAQDLRVMLLRITARLGVSSGSSVVQQVWPRP